MRYWITEASNRLFLVLSIIILNGLVSVGTANASFLFTPSQLNAAKAIGHACEGLIIAVARNPSLDTDLTERYNAHVTEVFKHIRPYFNKDIAEAKGIITRGALIAFARNPSLVNRINEIVEMCGEDIDSL